MSLYPRQGDLRSQLAHLLYQSCKSSLQASVGYLSTNQVSTHSITLFARMIFSLFQPWSKALEYGDGENVDPNSHRYESSSAKTAKVEKQLDTSTLISRGHLKHREAAVLIMRICLQSIDSPDRSVRVEIAEYLRFLERVEEYDFHPNSSFLGKHVLGVEGLSGSGKSSLIRSIISSVPSAVFIERQRQPEFLSFTARKALHTTWQYLENYRMALDVMESSCEVFLVEGYYHSFLANQVAAEIDSEMAAAALRGNVYAWPMDLPMPELVLFLTTSSEIRQSRLGTERVTVNRNRDNIANVTPAVYAGVRGPGTVGIDCSATPSAVLSTCLEALDYFGFYSISRPPKAAEKQQEVMQEEEPMMPTEVITNRRVSMGVYGMYSRF